MWQLLEWLSKNQYWRFNLSILQKVSNDAEWWIGVHVVETLSTCQEWIMEVHYNLVEIGEQFANQNFNQFFYHNA